MSIIKHTGAKSCYIPTNSATLRRRKYTIVSYQSRTEPKCAIRSSIYLDNKKLKWTIDNTTNSLFSQESSSSENNKPMDSMSTGHVTETDSQWEPSKEKCLSRTKNLANIKETDKVKIRCTLNTPKHIKQGKNKSTLMDWSQEDSD